MKKHFFLLLLIGSCRLAIAQTAMTNTGILYITGSTDILSAGSDFTNNSGSALTNNGQLYVKGNLVNGQASMATGSGTLYLNGTSAQTVSGAQPFKTWHLNTNNSAGITLNSNLSVSGQHTFTAGVIATSATPNYLVYEAGSSYTGDGDTKHVNGWVKKFGGTNFIFPLGNGSVERTVALNSLSVTGEFNAKHLASTPNTSQMQIPIWSVDNVEYWSIQKISGGSATVTMNWDKSKVYFPNYIVPDVRVAGYNGTVWANNGGTASGSAATTGTITSSSISSFNLFTFGSVSYILPLTLLDFSAVRTGNATQISWTTELEHNADHFVVERSDDGIAFSALAQIMARNSGATEQYSVQDNGLIRKLAYYRLRLVDRDDKETFSRIVAVRAGNSDGLLTLLANPVHDQVVLSASSQLNGMFSYAIHTMTGQLMQDGKLMIQNGGQYTLPLRSNTEAGSYILEVSSGRENFRYKIIVQ